MPAQPATLTGFPSWVAGVFELLSDAASGLADDGRVRFLNHAAARLVDREPGEAAGRLLQDLLPLLDEVTQEPFPPRDTHGWPTVPAPVPDPRATRRRRVRIAGDVENRLLEAVLVRFAPAPVDSITTLLVLRDRTAQLRAARALRASDERYRGFVERSAEGIWPAELSAPLPIDLPDHQQIDAFYRAIVIAEAHQPLPRIR